MTGLDDQIAALGGGGETFIVLMGVAALLGLRHATDPDHLTAVSTLVAGESASGVRRASQLGLAWGGGHALTLFVFGLPVVLFEAYIPTSAEGLAESAIGLLIMALAIRLLIRWRRGRRSEGRSDARAAPRRRPSRSGCCTASEVRRASAFCSSRRLATT